VVSEQDAQPGQARDLAAELRLRPERPPVTRLSRKVLMGLMAIDAITVAGALIWAFYQGRPKPTSSPELYNTDNKATPDGLSTLPRDYAGVPRNVTATREQIAAPTAIPSVPEDRTAPPTGRTDTPPVDPESLLNMQDRKSAFPNGPTDRKTVSPDRLANPVSRYVVQPGAIIPAALITGIRSDLPGQVTAQATENVFDSPTGRFLLIPQGSKLIGLYDSQISFGQDRVLLVWTRLIMPSGRSIVLERQPGANTQGVAGLEDEVDHHWGRLLTAAALSTVLGVGAELGATNNDSAIVTALRRGSTDSLNQTGQQLVRRNLNIQPTITIRPGFPVRVIVNRDLVLAPYQS
jgi:type IV secretion system protein TrbI